MSATADNRMASLHAEWAQPFDPDYGPHAGRDGDPRNAEPSDDDINVEQCQAAIDLLEEAIGYFQRGNAIRGAELQAIAVQEIGGTLGVVL